jgi:peptidoglycan/LPS O-acetylase OafA/YrhL
LATISFAIGLLVLPVALLAIVGASRLSVWPASLGFISGASLIGPLVSAVSIGEDSSPDYYDWLIVGSIIAAAAAAAFAAARFDETRTAHTQVQDPHG